MTDPARARRRIVLAVSAVALGGAIAGAILFARYAARAAPNPDRIAVAPFDVFAPGLEAWRVSLAEALTRRLQGGVPQELVARVWQAEPQPAIAAVVLARRTGAGLAVYGRLDPAPGDSLVARVAVMDAAAARLMFEVEARDAGAGDWRGGASPERLADSLAARIQRNLAASPMIRGIPGRRSGLPR